MRPRLAAWLAVACLLLSILCGAPRLALAQSTPVDVQQVQLEWSESGVFFSGNLKFELSAPVEDALRKGIPMYFVADAELLRDRWYWTDQKLASESRHMRLAFQPLTRRWRLNVSPTPISNTGLGVTLNQSFDSLQDALAAVQRFSRWKIAELSEAEPDAKLHVEFSFRLDVSQLPRPFQIGAVGQSEWNLAITRSMRLVFESGSK